MATANVTVKIMAAAYPILLDYYLILLAYGAPAPPLLCSSRERTATRHRPLALLATTSRAPPRALVAAARHGPPFRGARQARP